MSAFTFNCSSCGQHLSADTSYVGLQIVCPICGKTVVVPQAAAAPIAVAPAAPPLTPPPLPSQPKTSGLAIASLICSVGSFVILPLGFIPGIICGHMARKKIAATPGLQGAGLAKAGLIVGYIALVLQILAILALIAFFAFFATQVKRHSTSPSWTPRTVNKATRTAQVPPEKETADTEPDGSGWTLKLDDVAFPAGEVTGRIHGETFKVDKVAIEGGWLKFNQGKDFFADLGMEVVTFVSPRDLSGRTFTVPTKETGTKPHIWMKWKEAGANVPKQRCFTDRYALRLEFGEASGGKLPGKIYLCVPDVEKSFIAGAFEVPLKPGR